MRDHDELEVPGSPYLPTTVGVEGRVGSDPPHEDHGTDGSSRVARIPAR
jgi:hypothetical protein